MAKIIASQVSVDYPVYRGTSRSLRHALVLNPFGQAVRGAKHIGGAIARDQDGVIVVRALDNVSFAIDDGDRVGLIGQNGAGKTTLLRVLAGIYEPTRGSVTMEGRIVPLFNLTEGMMPEATGRELIKIRGVLLGYSPKEINDMAEDVVDFSELGSYIDMPVRTYSTGMLVRLAFAIATTVTADILLFDELIGAGDARFLDKAQQRLERLVSRSSSMVVATHTREALHKWCNRCFLLDHGSLVAMGTVHEVLAIYDERRTLNIA